MALLGTGVAALVATPANAQEDVQRVSVLNRSRPDYDPLGIRLGTIMVFPSIELGAAYDDNIFAQDTAKESDAIFVANPRLLLTSNTGTSSSQVSLSTTHERYASRSTENANDYFGSGSFKSTVGPTTVVNGGFNLVRRSEDRRSIGSFAQSALPIRYTTLEGQGGVQQALGSLRLEIDGRLRRAAYDRGVDQNGTPVNYDFRNFNVYQGTGRIGYSRTGNTQVYLAGTFNRRVYDLRPGEIRFDPFTQFDRTSTGLRVEVGYSRQISQLLYFTGQVGYLRQNFADSRLRTITGLSFVGNLLWNLSPLTSITARAERSVDETITPLAAGNLRTEVSARIDHELLRNLILSGDLRYADINPSGTTAAAADPTLIGFSQNSREVEGGAAAQYFINRRISINLDLRHRSRTSDNRFIAFQDNTATIGVRLGL